MVDSYWPRRRVIDAGLRSTLAAALAVALASCQGNPAPDAGEGGLVDVVREGGVTSAGCPLGQSRCDGACVDTQSSAVHCGTCGTVCAAGPNSTAACNAGVCRLRCAAGFADCDGVASNGCEVSLANAASSCGGCAIRCEPSDHAEPICRDALCGLECSAGFSDCDLSPETGCESRTSNDPENCGSCGNACPWPARSDFSCADSACGFVCRTGYADCDRAVANGCEVALLSARNCGACGTVCTGATPLCAQTAGVTRCVDVCPTGTSVCDGACVDTRANLEHCGACGNRCAAGTNAQAACVEGRCALECRVGYADCDGDPSNGCEVNLALNAQHCGACGNRCMTGPGGEGYCARGECRVRCAAGSLDCDENPATGCEANPSVDVRNCGACGNVCMDRPNGTALCVTGACEFACDPGFANCDGVATNGCETVLRSDPRHCGACGAACAAGQSCVDAQCVSTGCDPGRGECDGNTSTVCETDLFTSEEHCGACGSQCRRANALASCVAGGCQLDACLPGFGNCDRDRANGCETDVTTADNCGGCGVRCSFANATAACTDGSCRIAMCNARFANCDGDARNGCETLTDGNPSHCGRCGNACAAGQTCVAGVCTGGVMPPFDAGAGPEAGGVEAGGIDAAPFDMGVPPDGPALVDGGNETSPTTDAPAADGGDAGGCPEGRSACGTGAMRTCVDLQTDETNCGTCGNACAMGLRCAAGACVCPAGETLCGGRCVNPQNDAANCGACANACPTGALCTNAMCACPMGQTACGGACVDVQSDRANCGACANACPMGQLCSMGTCALSCGPGLRVCGSGAAMSCVNPQADENNCGACGNVCPAGQSCVMGACACPTGRSACTVGGTVTCLDLNADDSNCGACGNHCAGGSHCQGGMCRCAVTELSCGSGASQRCLNGSSDNDNCGSCGNRCVGGPNASSSFCLAGSCRQICDATFADCNRDPRDGCEAALTSDTGNCGTCGNACPARGQVCATGACACPGGGMNRVCTVGGVPTCVDGATDVNNCGSCGNVCPAAQVCRAGACVCAGANEIFCNGQCVNRLTSNQHCGACNTACTGGGTGTERACGGGTCNCPTGNPTYCMATDRCVNTATDRQNCGGCGTVCPAGQVCSGGMCGLVCAAPTSVCGTGAGMYCADLRSDNNNCGTCGTVCSGGRVCTAPMGGGPSSCQCPATQPDVCGGVCTNRNTDANNCGACGARCAAGTACSGGRCVCTTASTPLLCPPCPAGTSCAPTAMCVDPQTNNNHCGTCGTVCDRASGFSCQTGSCQCDPGRTDCSGTCVDTDTDNANCGACGRRCASGSRCSRGVCVGSGVFTGTYGTTWEEVTPRTSPRVYGDEGLPTFVERGVRSVFLLGGYRGPLHHLRYDLDAATFVDVTNPPTTDSAEYMRSRAHVHSRYWHVSNGRLLSYDGASTWREFQRGMISGDLNYVSTETDQSDDDIFFLTGDGYFSRYTTSTDRLAQRRLDLTGIPSKGDRMTYDPTGGVFIVQPGLTDPTIIAIDAGTLDITRLSSMPFAPADFTFCGDRSGSAISLERDSNRVYRFQRASGRWSTLATLPDDVRAGAAQCVVVQETATTGYLYMFVYLPSLRIFRLPLS